MDKAALAARFVNHQDMRLDQYIYLPSPATMDNMAQLTYYGQSIAQQVKVLHAAIETLEAYQQLLYDRAQEIVSAQWHLELRLEREKDYANKKVTYRLRLLKTYEVEGIHPELREETTFPGQERHKAIAAFKAEQKKHPGIIAEMSINKSRWE